jgi:hypothetical protein
MNPSSQLPDPGLGRNPPKYYDPRVDSLGMGMISAILVAGALVLGMFLYAMSGPSTNTASNPPPTTTGQGSPRTMAPVIDKVEPAPAAPSTTSPTTLPEIDRNVPAEKIAPPIKEPRNDN